MRKGMTLVEILIAAGLVILLGVMMLLGVLDQRRRARDASVVSAARQAQAAVEAYRAKNASYPGEALDLPAGDAELAEAFSYQAEPSGCAADKADTCRGYVLNFALEGRVGTLSGGACTLRQTGAITCVRE